MNHEEGVSTSYFDVGTYVRLLRFISSHSSCPSLLFPSLSQCHVSQGTPPFLPYLLFLFPFLFLLSLLCPLTLCSASVQNLITQPENKIDVGIAALTLAKEIYPEIDISSYPSKIDSMAAQVRLLARRCFIAISISYLEDKVMQKTLGGHQELDSRKGKLLMIPTRLQALNNIIIARELFCVN